jgi:hypothetical protein
MGFAESNPPNRIRRLKMTDGLRGDAVSQVQAANSIRRVAKFAEWDSPNRIRRMNSASENDRLIARRRSQSGSGGEFYSPLSGLAQMLFYIAISSRSSAER